MSARAVLPLIICGLSLLLSGVSASADITFGQLDDFQGNALGWQQGSISPNQPTVISSGGPSGDAYLQNHSSGGFGAGSKQIMFNTSQWTGDFITAGVTRINAEMANFGTTPLQMRIGFKDPLGTEYGSSAAVSLPADGGQWHAVTFQLTPTSLQLVTGSDSLSAALANVTEFRILSASSPNYNGDTMVSTVGVDEIRALTLPGDADHNGKVDFSDLVVLARHYGSSSASWNDGDFNFDGKVGFDDLVTLARNYGTSIVLPAIAPAAAADFGQLAQAVPEPGELLMLLLAVTLLSRRAAELPDATLWNLRGNCGK